MAHILLAEDSAPFRRLVRAQLIQLGHEVTCAQNGDIAWQHYQSATFDRVLTDLQMPTLDGFALMQKIRAVDRRLPIVAMTGLADKSRLQQVLQAGADLVLNKPFSVNCLKYAMTIERTVQDLGATTKVTA